MWNDYYLKFSDEEDYRTHMPQEWQEVPYAPERALDVLGVLYSEGTCDANGNVVEPATVREGFHLNLRLDADADVPEELLAFIITPPVYPQRVFAGEA